MKRTVGFFSLSRTAHTFTGVHLAEKGENKTGQKPSLSVTPGGRERGSFGLVLLEFLNASERV